MKLTDDIEKRLESLITENSRLRRSLDELSGLHELAVAMGAAHNLQEIIRMLTHRALRMLHAEQGVITLLHPEDVDSGGVTLIRTSYSSQIGEALRPADFLLRWMTFHKRQLLLNDPHNDRTVPDASWDASVRSVLSVPLLVQSKMIGLFTIYNKKAGAAFSDADARLMGILAAQSAQVIERSRVAEEHEHVVQVFGQHVAPEIVNEILRGGSEVKSRRQHVCVMFVDIRDFTSFAEHRPPEEVVEYLNSVLGFVIEAVRFNYGTAHRLLGDGMVALFGAPVPRGNSCQNAVDAATAIVEWVDEASRTGRIPETRIGVGIHAGEVVVGTVGTLTRREYQVNGDVVNLASRIETLNKRFGSRTLISDAVWKELDREPDGAVLHRRVEVAGRMGSVDLYEIA